MSSNDFSDMMRQYLPTSFGKKSKKETKVSQNQFKRSVENQIYPSANTAQEKKLNSTQNPNINIDNNDEVDEFGTSILIENTVEDEEDGQTFDFEQVKSKNLPITHEIVLKDHQKPVTALTLDPAGSRLVTGGRDEFIKFWDFNGMDGNFRPFLTAKEVCGNNPIRDMQFSISGDQFLVTSGASEAKILTREGNEVTHTVKGDPYLRDARNTKGHTSALTSGRWHPSDKNVFVTSSIDSTLRIWDINRCKAGQTYVISVKSKLPGTRSPITCTTYTADGKVLLACAQDGAIHAWSSNGPFIRPSIDIDNAHCQGSGASGVAFAFNNINFTTRGLDDTVKLWDLRNTKNPIASTPPNLPNFFEETNIMFSPNEELILTGVSVKKNDPSHGKIVLLNSLNLEVIKEVKISLSASVIKVLWHPRINQIVTGISNGSCHVLYDPLVSVRGATICAAKKAKMAEFDHIDLQTNGVIVNPNALPMFRTDGNNQKSKKRQREDKNKFKPEMPLSVKGKRGELNTKAVDFIMKTREVDSTRLEDPREAILKHADDADEDPYWVAPAYDKNQPKPVFSQSVFETEEEERQESLKKRRA